MNILFSLTYYYPYISGLTNLVKEIAEKTAKNANQVSVLCFKHRDNLADTENINQVNVIRVRPWLKINKGFISGEWVTKSWKRVAESDVVVVNLPQVEGWMVALMAKILKKKLVATYTCRVDTQNELINSLVDIANDLTLKLADKVVALTVDYVKSLPGLDKYKNKLTYVYPLIKKPGINRAWEREARSKIGNNQIIIGAAARMAAEKGLEYFLDIIPLLKNNLQGEFKLVIAGSVNPVGEEKYIEKVRKLILNYKDKIILLGTVPEDGMGSFYRLLDVLVLPSINSTEAFGMVQVEAMLYGVPVIASDLPGVRIPVEKTGMGKLVPIKNSQKLAEAIIDVIRNKKNYVRHKRNAETEFNYKKTKEQWLKLFMD